MRIDVIHSAHDGGYYAEVWLESTGVTLHTTAVYPSAAAARAATRAWIEARCVHPGVQS